MSGGTAALQHCSGLTPRVADDKHEIVTVDTGYKVYMKLHIRHIARADIAEYRCVAKNSLGHSDGSISLYGGQSRSDWFHGLVEVNVTRFRDRGAHAAHHNHHDHHDIRGHCEQR